MNIIERAKIFFEDFERRKENLLFWAVIGVCAAGVIVGGITLGSTIVARLKLENRPVLKVEIRTIKHEGSAKNGKPIFSDKSHFSLIIKNTGRKSANAIKWNIQLEDVKNPSKGSFQALASGDTIPISIIYENNPREKWREKGVKYHIEYRDQDGVNYTVDSFSTIKPIISERDSRMMGSLKQPTL